LSAGSAAPHLFRQQRASDVLAPAIFWLIVNFLFAAWVDAAAHWLISIPLASWAAVDCAKIQTHGSRVLGIAFKPVVVFAVVALLFWGLGFIWYLVLRHRVKSTSPEFVSPQTAG
jgi:hypothetical protein